MPNWCENTAIISCNNTQTLLDFAEKFNTWDKEVPYDNSSSGWVGRYLHNSGTEIFKVNIRGDAFERAFVSDAWLDGDVFHLEFSSAWSPAFSWLIKICDKFLGEDNYDITFTSDESGNGIHCTNDPLYLNTYIWDYCGDDEHFFVDDNWNVSADFIEEKCIEVLGEEKFKEVGFDEAILLLQEEVDDLYISEWEEASIYDF